MKLIMSAAYQNKIAARLHSVAGKKSKLKLKAESRDVWQQILATRFIKKQKSFVG